MKLYLVLCILTFFVVFSNSSRIRIDSDGGYTGIVIRINSDVPEESCSSIISNLQNLLQESSSLLYKVLSVYFKSASLVIPSSWKDGKCGRSVGGPKGDNTPYRGGDIFISSLEGIALSQSQGCHHSGDYLRLSHQFLSPSSSFQNNLSSKVFVQNWFKFRYGVFDDFGYSGNVLYPNYYIENNQIFASGIQKELSGYWSFHNESCSPLNSKNCNYVLSKSNDNKGEDVHEEIFDNLSCFLDSQLSQSSYFCRQEQVEQEKEGNNDDNESRSKGPTQQNVLCDGVSIESVIHSNPDFMGLRLKESSQTLNFQVPPITFSILREPLTTYVLLLETSVSMNEHQKWKWINKAAQKFIRYDLPMHTHCAIVTFSNESKVEHGLVQVNGNEIRGRLADAIPDKYHLSRGDERCVLCALQTVLHDVLKNNLGGAHIILISQGSPDTLSLTDENIIRNYISDYDIQLSTILLPQSIGDEPLAFYDEIHDVMEGTNTNVIYYQDSVMDFYVRLNEAFAKILHANSLTPTEVPEFVHKAEIVIGDALYSLGRFFIDSTLGRETTFGIYVQDEEEHLIKSIRFKDSFGSTYGPFYRMSSTFDLVNFKTINFPSGQIPPFNTLTSSDNMIWEYKIEWYPSSKAPVNNRKNIVIVTSKPRTRSQDSLIHTKAWLRNSSDFYTLYVGLIYGGHQSGMGSGRPIAKAQVSISASVEDLVNGTSTNQQLGVLHLSDSGNGDPDILSSDGVYSVYLGNYLSQLGRYKFTIYVDNTNASAFIVNNNNNNINNNDKEKNERLGSFRRVVDGPVLHIKTPNLHRRALPIRIMDFRVIFSSSEKLIVSWTEPSENVFYYRLIYSRGIVSALFNSSLSRNYTLFEFSKNQVNDSLYEFVFPHFDEDYYLGILGVNEFNEESKLSNLVHVRIASPPTNTPTHYNSDDFVVAVSEDSDSNKEFNWILIGIILGVISVLLLFIFVAFAYYFLVVRNKKTVKSGSLTSSVGMSETDSHSFDSDIKNILNHPLGGNGNTHHSSLGRPNENNPSPNYTESTNSANTLTPVYWSASQLLSKLDTSSPHHHLLYSIDGYPSLPPNHWHHYPDSGTNIPEEFTITVGNLEDTGKGKVKPPPVLPKPRNITQV